MLHYLQPTTRHFQLISLLLFGTLPDSFVFLILCIYLSNLNCNNNCVYVLHVLYTYINFFKEIQAIVKSIKFSNAKLDFKSQLFYRSSIIRVRKNKRYDFAPTVLFLRER